MRRIAVLAVLFSLLFAGSVNGQTGLYPPNLTPSSTPPPGTAVIPVWEVGVDRAKKTTVAGLRTGLTSTALWFNVRDYGALGDNANNDTSGIQGAITAACAAGGGLVFLPRGIYRVSAALTVTCAGVMLVGEGTKATTIRTTSTTADVVSFGTSPAFSPCGGIKDMSIDSSVTRTAGTAIVVDNCEYGHVENIRLSTTGGNGISLSPGATTLSGLWFFHHFDIEISGAFTGIIVNGSNDQYFSDGWIRGTSTAGSRGIQITGNAGSWWSNIDVVLFERGVDIAPGAGRDVVWLHMMNVLSDTNTARGFSFVLGTGAIRGFTCTACWSSTNGAASVNGRGFYIDGGDGYVFASPRVINNGGHGFEIGTASNVSITGGLIAGNSVASSGLAHGIITTGTTGLRVTATRIGPAAGASNTQGYGLFLNTGTTDFSLIGNDLRGNVTGGMNNVPGISSARMAASNLPLSAGNESFSGTGTCTNQFVTALVGGSAPTCTTDVLASAYHANQGTATTVLHGNAAGNPSWGQVTDSDLASVYALLAGRAGGQSILGGTAASEILTLRGTAHSTPGTVRVDDSAFVFNEAGADRDFRAEGDTEANLLFLDASTDRIGIGTATPSERFHVVGKSLLDGSADAVQLTVQGHSTQTAAILTTETSAGTDVLNVYSTGVIEAPLIHNAGGTGATSAIASGTWTPTLTGVTNVAASTAYEGQWMRVGNVVTASGKFDCDPTASALTTLRISLPVASNFTAGNQLGGGGAHNGGVAMQAIWFEASAATDAAEATWIPVDAANRTHSFSFSYLVQ